MLRPGRRDERGETLVEVLVAVVILGIAGVAVAAGLMLTVKSSDIHRKETTGSAYVRSFAEAIQQYVSTPNANNYINCAGQNAYKVAAVVAAMNLPASYTATQAAAKSVGSNGQASSCATDTGVQQLTLKVASNDGRANESLVIILRKPCDPSVNQCTS